MSLDMFPDAAIADLVERQSRLRDRISTTYMTATAARHGHGVVSIHVGQDVWDYLRSIATTDSASSFGEAWTLFGFPVLLEAAWEPTNIEVRTSERIHE